MDTDGNVTCGGNLSVTGTSTLTGAISAGGAVAATGAVSGTDGTFTGDIDGAGGFRMPILFSQDDVTASQTDTVLALHGGDAALVNLPMYRAGSVVGISAWTEGARTGGTCTVDATVGGTKTGLTAVIDDTNTQVNSSSQAKDTDTFAADDLIGVKLTTDGTWAAGVTPSIIVCVWVEC